MSWRTVVVSSRCKLDTRMGYMVIRGEEVRRIFLDEIAVVIIENPAVAMTGCLLSELMERKIKVIFCDSRHMPQGELVPYYGSHDTSRKIRTQIAWQENTKGAVWSAIIGEKIGKLAQLLLDCVDREKSQYENRLTIDKDLCEFYNSIVLSNLRQPVTADISAMAEI